MQTMKPYGRVDVISPPIFSVGTGWCWVISVTTRERALSRSGHFGDYLAPAENRIPAASVVCIPSVQSRKTKIQNEANRYFRGGNMLLVTSATSVKRQHRDIRMITVISISDLCVVTISQHPMHSTFAFISLQWTVRWSLQNYEGIVRTYISLARTKLSFSLMVSLRGINA